MAPPAPRYDGRAAFEAKEEIDYYLSLDGDRHDPSSWRARGDKPEWAEAYLLAEYKSARAWGFERPRKMDIIVMGIRLGMSAQEVGRFCTRLQRELDGEPRQTAKTPEQVAILQAFLEVQPYPSRVDLQDLVIATGGLTRKQIDAWFSHERQKYDVLLQEREPSSNERDPVWVNNPRCTWKKWDEWFDSVKAGEADLTYESYVASIGPLVEGRRY